ncbi:hypothetical protein Krac_3397 [Ktedonobacter racemifer DSM 44963]|uniref:Uncharacterized protein n=1 Tax=Ktedonobacter racemifer DSM 44963 TaxID=485913 RepID=D6U183_KTERA|nr:hypothetical protein Krac_3397 [Ktedonobacter racemifer DSM 44963]
MARMQPSWNLSILEGIFGVARYSTDNDRMQHAIIATKKGRLYGVQWDIRTFPSTSSLIKLCQFKPLSCLAGVYSCDDGYQHVIVARSEGESGSLFEIAFKQPQLTEPRLLVRLPAAVQRVGMAGFLFNAKITSLSGFFSLDDTSSHIITSLESGCVYDVNYNNKNHRVHQRII